MAGSNFERNYAKAIAEALRQAEDSPPSRDAHVLLEETYRQLCYDCPIGLSSTACLQLGKILLGEEKSYRKLEYDADLYILSDRLLNGLLQALDKIERPSAIVPPAMDEASTEPVAQHESFVQPLTDQDADSALATLAWNIFGRIPLKVLTAGSLKEAAKYVGTYRGNPVDLHERDNTAIRDPPEQPNELPDADDIPIVANGNGHVILDGNDNMNEVWAEESDGSEFEFESDRFHVHAHLHHDESVTTAIRQADSWLQVAQSITNLLSYLSFTKLSSMSMTHWKRLEISNHLSQLSFMLLLQQPSTELLNVFPPEHWQRLALYPIHYFRDATLHHTNDLLNDYLQFLSTLMQIQTTTNVSLPSTLMPCTILGVSLLSALCSSLLGESKQQRKANLAHIKTARQAILEGSDDLTIILETAMSEQTASSQSDHAASAVLPWTFLSLWQVVVASCGNVSPALENAHAQTLLNTGLFRQWLQWWERLVVAGDDEACHVVQESIFDLCLVSPNLLGKYAWRFPGFAGRVCQIRNDSSQQVDTDIELASASRLVDAILWNLLAADFADAPSAPTITWKKKTKDDAIPMTLPPPLLSTCQDAAWTGFQLICELATESITDWKRRRVGGLPASTKLELQRKAVVSFMTLMDRLVSTSQLLSEDFLTRITGAASYSQSPPISAMVRLSCLEPIHDIILKWPSASLEPMQAKVKCTDTDGDVAVNVSGTAASTQELRTIEEANNQTADPGARKARLDHQAINDAIRQLRRSLKSFQSLIDVAVNNKRQGHTTKYGSSMSSKAD
ncbi:hypothetical protein MPSEU_000341100 [Mayamaea pseudoterrestris]|nr:hypothetical protein MPSEU_000341100 [Mayamaea pseudoterrestris]